MQPVRTADANTVYKAPPSMPDCGDLWVHRIRPGVIRSTWEPTPAELAILNEGGRIHLTLCSEPIPPIMLEVIDKDITEPVGPHGWRIDREPAVSPTKETTKNNGAQSPTETTTEQAPHRPPESPPHGQTADPGAA